MPNVENLEKRKVTGGKRKAYRGRRRRERKAQPRLVELGPQTIGKRRVRGGNIVAYVIKADKVNAETPETVKNVKIL